jgi:hypothetical protein
MKKILFIFKIVLIYNLSNSAFEQTAWAAKIKKEEKIEKPKTEKIETIYSEFLLGTNEYNDYPKEYQEIYTEQLHSFFEKYKEFNLNKTLSSPLVINELYNDDEKWTKIYDLVDEACKDKKEFEQCRELGKYRADLIKANSLRNETE